MYGKDLEKEGWIKFSNKLNLIKKFNQNEIDEMVYEAYKNNCKYNPTNINTKLKKRFEEMNIRKES